ncbi:MAG: acyl-CoA dehydrogenase [Ilumatobacteraceae bacterium]|nr:acyl-CoA dehydrogenase [Ilumatobacteraceae bacterium]
MQFSFTSDQHEFAAGLREMLEREFSSARLRHVWDSGDGHDPALWARLAEMGVLSMMMPESDGGLGGDFVDTVLLVEELGRAAAPGPVVETMVVGALALGGTRWAAGIVDGSTPVTAALLGERYVPHTAVAPLVLVAHGGTVDLLDHPLIDSGAIEGLDGGRRLATLTDITGGTALAADLERLTDAGALATAAYLLGLSTRMLGIAGDYARDRRQFGQPIGAFQAVKHLMADALLKVEFARPAIYRAAWSFANDTPDRGRDVSMAKALVSDAALKAARSALQVHGAIGYTWECDLQLFMKKAWALAPAWGSAQQHRRRVADAVLGPR